MMLTTLTLAVALALPGEAELQEKLPEIFAKSAAHYRALDAAATPLRKGEMSRRKGRRNSDIRTPHGFNRKTGKLAMHSIYGWTAGHFPGSLWYLYEATGDAFFRDRATEWTEILAPNASVDDNHDVGFIMYCSYGNARRLLKTDRYDGLLRQTAASLCRRYNAKLGLIRSWGALDETKNFLVIPDNMMNLELLEWAAGAGKREQDGPDFAGIAVSHADMTMRHHFRADGGCYHVLDYDQDMLCVKEVRRGQGAGCESAWSRGQSWAIYGFTMMYRMTGFARYLAFAQKLADYAIGHPNMPADGIPHWDYGAPGEERDSSAGSCMASALLELSQYVDAHDRARYRSFAVKQLLSLASPAYFSEGDEIGHFLLKHGVGSKPGNSEIDTPLNYGDYYFLEALLRFRELKAQESKREDVRTKLPARAVLPDSELASRARTAGEADSTRILSKSLSEAETALKVPIPETSDALYEEFWSTGNRTHYQEPYFARLKFVDALSLAEKSEGKGRFLPRIADYLVAICDMKSWVLPAHDRSDGSRGNLRGTCLTVDLFSSEVAAHLAGVLRLVGDRLDPQLVQRVKNEAQRRVFAPLRRELAGGGALGYPAKLHWWVTGDNNWNAVCWDNVVCAALGLLDDCDDRAFFVTGALAAVPQYLGGFTSDGYCSEGMGYWNYGYGHHLLMGRLLRAVTDGKLDIFTEPIQRQVAAYPRSYTLCEGVSPAFADGNGAASRKFLRYVDEIWPDLPKDLPPASEFPVGQVWLLRDPDGLSVAFKGGHNGEFHNHNDVGSYYVVRNGRFVGGEAGGEEYTRFTFSNLRYESKLNNSYGHPVPVVGGRLQSTGRAFAAKVLSKDLSAPKATVVLDLTKAYEAPTLKSLVRTFAYDRTAKTFTVTDKVVFAQPTAFESPFNTYLEAANPSHKGKIEWNVRPEVAAAGGAYELVEEDVANPGRIAPRRVAVRFAAPVSEAEVVFTYRAR